MCGVKTSLCVELPWPCPFPAFAEQLGLTRCIYKAIYIHIYVYTYIYVCMCVCVCVRGCAWVCIRATYQVPQQARRPAQTYRPTEKSRLSKEGRDSPAVRGEGKFKQCIAIPCSADRFAASLPLLRVLELVSFNTLPCLLFGSRMPIWPAALTTHESRPDGNPSTRIYIK